MGSLIQALILTSDEQHPYSVPDPEDPKNDALRIKVPYKVFFLYDIDTLLIPGRPIGTYLIEFYPENKDPIQVTPEPDALFKFWEFREEIGRWFPSFNHGHFLQYHLFTKGTDRDKAISDLPPEPGEVKGFRIE
jgi:hypothetical protein